MTKTKRRAPAKKTVPRKTGNDSSLYYDHDGPNCLSRKTYFPLYPRVAFKRSPELKQLLTSGSFKEIRNKLHPIAQIADDIAIESPIFFFETLAKINGEYSKMTARDKTELFLLLEFGGIYPPPEILEHIANAIRNVAEGDSDKKDLCRLLGITGKWGGKTARFLQSIQTRDRILWDEIHFLMRVYAACSLSQACKMVSDRQSRMSESDAWHTDIHKTLEANTIEKTNWPKWKKTMGPQDKNDKRGDAWSDEDKLKYLQDQYDRCVWPAKFMRSLDKKKKLTKR